MATALEIDFGNLDITPDTFYEDENGELQAYYTDFDADTRKQYEEINSTITWEVKRFKELLSLHTDNLYKDGDEKCPLRTSLVQNGECIGMPSIWLLNLFMDLHNDTNNNVDTQQLGVECTMRLVQHPKEEQQIFSYVTLSIHSVSTGLIHVLASSVGAMKPNTVTTLAGQFNWSKVSEKLEPDESLFISMKHYVFLHPIEWGLNSDAVNVAVRFMCSNEINDRHPDQYDDILAKCSTLKITGITECLTRARTQL